MKMSTCPSIVRKRLDEELSKLEYGEIQKAKSLGLAIGLCLIFLIMKIIEHS